METKKPIPAHAAIEYESWELPQIDDRGNICSSAEKELREKRSRELKKGELIEQVDVEIEKQVSAISVEELEKITQQAYEEGFQKGQLDGRKEGYEEGKKKGTKLGVEEAYDVTKEKVEQVIAQLAAAVDLLQFPIEEQQGQIEKSLLIIIQRLTEAVIGRELLMDTSQIQNLIRQSIAVLPVGAKNICITINPEDYQTIVDYGMAIKEEWRLTSDPAVSVGGCQVATEHSFVDNTIEKRLEKIINDFLKSQQTGISEAQPTDNIILDEDAASVNDADPIAETVEPMEAHGEDSGEAPEQEAQIIKDSDTDEDKDPSPSDD